MKRKHFRLQKVLEVRELKEKKQQKELALVKRKLTSEEKELQRIQEKKNDFTQTMINIGKPSVSQMLSWYDYFITLSEHVDSQRSVIENSRNEVEQERQKLIQTTTDKKVLENLKEKFIHQINEEQNKNEQILIDEIAARTQRA